jgi:hypothetical protein
MSLEKRLSDALHQADVYQPSVDLFARLSRSIDEDKAHRRRMRSLALAVIGGLALVMGFLIAVAGRDAGGALGMPKWSIQVVLFTLLTACLLALGPAIRRLGQPYLADVFYMSPVTGKRFAGLLDIAYYLFFGGGILSSLDLTEGGSLVVGSDGMMFAAFQVALFLTLLGLAHALNLSLLPVVGLLFSSLTRRARRNTAGAEAPPVSPRARRADRLTMAIVIAVGLLGTGGVLVLIALMLRGL